MRQTINWKWVVIGLAAVVFCEVTALTYSDSAVNDQQAQPETFDQMVQRADELPTVRVVRELNQNTTWRIVRTNPPAELHNLRMMEDSLFNVTAHVVVLNRPGKRFLFRLYHDCVELIPVVLESGETDVSKPMREIRYLLWMTEEVQE